MPTFLGLTGVLAIHDDQIRLYGGSYGVRSWSALESRISQPAATFGGGFLYGDLCAMAAALGHGIITSHPFVDGNKRTGGMALLAFLAMNGVPSALPQTVYYDLVMAVATGNLDHERLAGALRRWAS